MTEQEIKLRFSERELLERAISGDLPGIVADTVQRLGRLRASSERKTRALERIANMGLQPALDPYDTQERLRRMARAALSEEGSDA